jgi:transcriptional regulator
MYLPKYHKESDLAVMHELIRAYPLGTWVTQSTSGLTGNHLPFILDAERGSLGTLRAHVSRANPVWKELATTEPSLIMFQGPQSYISPTWYPTKKDNGKVVPTWNYVAVHAHGTATVIQDGNWILEFLTDLTNQQESPNEEPWAVTDAPAEYIERLLKAVVGIEIVITELNGRWKLSQDEELANRLGTVRRLLEQPESIATSLSALMAERIQ